jgi:hypothetical protein
VFAALGALSSIGLATLEPAAIEDDLDVIVPAERARERVVALGLISRHNEQDSSRARSSRVGPCLRSLWGVHRGDSIEVNAARQTNFLRCARERRRT